MLKKPKKRKSMPFVIFRGDHLRSTSGIICGSGSFAALYTCKSFQRLRGAEKRDPGNEVVIMGETNLEPRSYSVWVWKVLAVGDLGSRLGREIRGGDEKC